jgi:hypothetical protein
MLCTPAQVSHMLCWCAQATLAHKGPAALLLLLREGLDDGGLHFLFMVRIRSVCHNPSLDIDIDCVTLAL